MTERRVNGVPLGPEQVFAGGGEMGALMRSTDWAKTRLGAIDTWPQSLRTIVGVLLGSRFPMLVWWGRDLLHLYNDAYRPILRDKHPASLAAPAAEIWAEIWDVAGPLANGVLNGGPATWIEDLQLFIASSGMAEETYFTFSYSPIPGDDGKVGGLLNTVQETTAKVQGEREIRMLHDLAARVGEAKSESEAFRLAAEVFGGNELDLPFTGLYVAEGEDARLAAWSGWPGYRGAARPERLPLAGGAWALSECHAAPQGLIVGDLEKRFGPLPAGRWNGIPREAMVLPLHRAGPSAHAAYLVAGISPHRKLDDRYRRFFQAAARQFANVLANARSYEAERKRAEALAEIDRAKTVFLSNVSHEFRTPLTLLLGPVEDALRQSNGGLHGEPLQSVHRNALRLLRLVNSLLDFARIESGRHEMTFVAVDLATLTADLANSFRSVMERAGLKLTVDCPALPEPVYVDPAQWEKIVLNLVSNAFKFTLQGEISVSLSWSAGGAELKVRDTGIGIPATELGRVFERFHRVEGSQGRSYEGTGIGLSLVQELVKLHEGAIRVSSEPGKGTEFVVTLKAGRAHLPADRVFDRAPATASTAMSAYLLEASHWLGGCEEATGLRSEEGPDTKTSGAREGRVLVVDDSADMRDYLRRLLAERWKVDLAVDGLAGLAAARANPPDLVLSDVMMPGLDGVGLLKELRANPETRNVPVILLSARAGEEAVLAGLESGADDYLVKPFGARELLARVQTHLHMAHLRRQWADELQRANSELEAYSFSVSHDLRTPLRAIDGFSQILAEDHASKLDADGRRCLDKIRRNTARMGTLIDDLLKFSRMGRAALQPSPLDVAEMARAVFDEWRGAHPGRRIELRLGNLPRALADRSMTVQVLANLIGNAVKYTAPREEAWIEIRGEAGPSENTYAVCDNGVGFDMKHAPRLFGVFQRLHTTEEFEGTGIGLALVQRIVQRHGGRIWADASPGRGATFTFTLPRADASP